MPEYIPEIKYFEAEEIEAILAATRSLRDKAMIYTIYQCAMRRAEVQFLTRHDYNKGRGLLRVTRLKKRSSYWHEIVLFSQTKRLLDKYLATRHDHHDALFLSARRDGPVGPDGVYFAFRYAAERAGIALLDARDERGIRHPSPHRLRHSFIVHEMNCGIPIEDIMEHAAHNSINTTMTYARTLTPRKRRNAMLMEASHCFART